MSSHFIGIDIGTGSARAGVFDEQGVLLASAKADIVIWHAEGHVVEQSSNDVWRAVAATVREAVSLAGISAQTVHGIGFDATCSLVVLGPGGAPLTVSPSGDRERNIIVWMDHRAIEQARRINDTGEGVLRYVGGTISPEMETPKLLWLAQNMPRTFAAAWQFMDLADFLSWRATGSLARSTCTVTCKWTYLAHEARWDDAYFRKVGLGALADEKFARIGTEIVAPGTALSNGLTNEAAAELGLLPGTPVAAGMIDAHAGGIGSVGARGGAGGVTTRMAYVFGTSACTMTTTEQAASSRSISPGSAASATVPGRSFRRCAPAASGLTRSPSAAVLDKAHWCGSSLPTRPARWSTRRPLPSRCCSARPCSAPSPPATIPTFRRPCRPCRRWARSIRQAHRLPAGMTGALRPSNACKPRRCRYWLSDCYSW